MITRKHGLLVAVLACSALSGASAAYAQDAVSTYTGGTQSATFFAGQSFTIGNAGLNYTNLTFNFYAPGLVASAPGTLYLFNQAYTGSPNGLSTAGSVARATGSGGTYSFGSTYSFAGGAQLFAYANTVSAITGSASGAYAGGNLFSSGSSSTSNFSSLTDQDANFRATASVVAAAVPEPATWGMMVFGFGAMGVAMRLRQKVRISYAA